MIDPELHRSIVELDMVRSIDISPNGVVDVTVSLTTPGLPDQGPLPDAPSPRRSSALEGVTHVNVYFDVLTDTQKAALQQKLGRGSLPAGSLAQVANVICIGSGKGGVGKSTLTANLAAALDRRRQARGDPRRRRLGLLDPAHVRPRRDAPAGLGRAQDHPARGPRREGHVDRLLRRGGRRGRVARADAAQGAHPVPAGRRLGRARLPARRPTAGHRRRLDDARAAAAAGASS